MIKNWHSKENTNWEIFEATVKHTRQMLSYHSQVEALRQAEARAEQEGNIQSATAFFAARMETIIAGPSASQALQMAGR